MLSIKEMNKKIFDKLKTAATYILITIIGIIMLPYLLWCGWVRYYSLKKISNLREVDHA